MCSYPISYERYVQVKDMGNHRCNPMGNLWDRDRVMASDINEYIDLVDTSISSEKTIKRKEGKK